MRKKRLLLFIVKSAAGNTLRQCKCKPKPKLMPAVRFLNASLGSGLDNYGKLGQIKSYESAAGNTLRQCKCKPKPKLMPAVRFLNASLGSGLDNYGKLGQIKSYEKTFSSSTEGQPPYEKLKRLMFYYPLSENATQKADFDKHVKFAEQNSYQFTYWNNTKGIARSEEAKLGDIKHHVFILKIFNKSLMEYKAFCAGSIITEKRVLTSAQCFYTNRKRLKQVLGEAKVVGGLMSTVQSLAKVPAEQQWRTPKHVHTQKFYRFPAYSLAIIVVDKPWIFNNHVNKIPYAKSTLDYDGVCTGTVVRITKSWAYKKYLFTEQHKIIPREKCERKLLRTCRLYICTMAEGANAESETAGGGLVCFETGTQEEDPTAGLLVGVTVLINIGLPSLHHRIAMFDKWVTDGTTRLVKISQITIVLLFVCLYDL